MKASVEVTRYEVVDDELVSAKTTEDVEVILYEAGGSGGLWLSFANGPQSIRVDNGRAKEIREGGWLAQRGTPPVNVDGQWGGRNYAEYRMRAEEVRRVLDALPWE